MIRLSNSLDPDQARQFVRPDLGPNCLQRLSADDTGKQNSSNSNNLLPLMSCHQNMRLVNYPGGPILWHLLHSVK